MLYECAYWDDLEVEIELMFFFVTDLPIKIPGLSGVVEVACGAVFNVARCNDGRLYSWGLGEKGELCRYTTLPLKLPPQFVQFVLYLFLLYRLRLID